MSTSHYILEVQAKPEGLNVLAKEFLKLEETIARTAKSAEAAMKSLTANGGGAGAFAAMRAEMEQTTAAVRTLQAQNEVLTQRMDSGAQRRTDSLKKQKAAVTELQDAHVKAADTEERRQEKLHGTMNKLRAERVAMDRKALLGMVEAENRAVSGVIADRVKMVDTLKRLAQDRVQAAHRAAQQEYEANQKATLSLINKGNPEWIAQQKAQLKGVAAEARNAAAAHEALAKAQHELKSAARGAAGGLNMLWTTYGASTTLLVGAFAVSAGIKDAIKSAAEWQYQMTFVGAIAREEGESVASSLSRMGDVSKKTLDMMKNSLYTPIEGAEALRQLAQAGLTTEQSLAALPSVLNLATVGEMKLSEAAFSAVAIMHSFNLTVSDMGTVTDHLAKAAAMSTTSVNSITESVKQASVVGEQYGVTLDQTLAGLTLLADRGIRGTAAGTAFRNMVVELYSPTDRAAKTLERLGVKTFDASGQIRTLEVVMGELRGKMEGLDKKSQLAVLNELFNERSRKAASAYLDELTRLPDILDRIKNSQGFAQSTTDALKGTLKGEWQQMLSSLKASFIEAGKAAEEPLLSVVIKLRDLFRSRDWQDGITSMMKGFGDLASWVVSNGSTIVTFVEAVLAYKAGKFLWAGAASGILSVGEALANTGSKLAWLEGFAALATKWAGAGGLIALALFGGFQAGGFLYQLDSVRDGIQNWMDTGPMATFFRGMAYLDKLGDRAAANRSGFGEFSTGAATGDDGNPGAAFDFSGATGAAARQREEAAARAARQSELASYQASTSTQLSSFRRMEAAYTNTGPTRGMPTGTGTHATDAQLKKAREALEAELSLLQAHYKQQERSADASYQNQMTVLRAYHSARMLSDEELLAKETALTEAHFNAGLAREEAYIAELLRKRKQLGDKSKDVAKIDAEIEKARADLLEKRAKREATAIADAIKAWKSYNDAGQSVLDNAKKANGALEEEVKALRANSTEKRDSMLVSIDARIALEEETLQRLQNEAALFSEWDILTASEQAKLTEIEIIKKRTAELKKERTARQELLAEKEALEGSWVNGAIRGLQAYQKESLSTAKLMEDVFRKAFQGIEDALMNFVKTGRLNIRSLLTQIGDDVLRMLIRLNITQPLAGMFQGFLGGLGGSAAGAAAGGGGSILGTIGNIGSNLFGGIGNFGGSVFGSIGSGLASMGTSLFGAGSATTGLGLGMSSAGAGGIFSSVLSGAGNLAAGATSTSFALGQMLPGIGTALAIGYMLYQAFKKPGGPKEGGSFFGSYDSAGAMTGSQWQRLFTPSGADGTVKDLAGNVSSSYYDIVKSLGGTAGALTLGLGFDTDPRGTADNRISSYVGMNGQTIFQSQDRNVGRDEATLQSELALEAKRALLAALQNTDFASDALEALFDTLDVATASVDQIDKLLAEASDLKATLAELDKVTLKGLDLESLRAFQLQGESLSETFNRVIGPFREFEEALKTPAERLAEMRTQIDTAFGSVGVVVPQTSAAFLEIVRGLDLSTEAGRRMYMTLMGVAPAFREVQAAAAAAIASFQSAAGGISPIYSRELARGNLESAVSQWMGLSSAHSSGWTMESTIANIGTLANSPGGMASALAYAQSLGGNAVDILTRMIEAYGQWQSSMSSSMTGASSGVSDFTSAVGDATTTMQDYNKSIREWAENKLLSGDSPLLPAEQLTAALNAYERVVSTQDRASFTGAADAFLEEARGYYGSSADYTAIFNRVVADAEALGGFKLSYKSDVQAASLDALRADLVVELRLQRQDNAALQAQVQALITTIANATQEQVAAIYESARTTASAVVAATERA